MKNYLNNLSKGKNRGQVAVVILFVIAAALIFYAASINIGRTSGVKTVVEISSNMGASQLGSQMASYGQSILQSQLGGKKRICAFSGLFMAVIMAVIIIILVAITILCVGTCAGFTALTAAQVIAIYIASTVAVTASIASVALSAAVIEPGLTNMWNKFSKVKNLSLPDQFIEGAIRAGIQTAATDSKRVPDATDFDLDRLFGFDTSIPGTAVPNDEISRFGFYYTLRFKQLQDASQEDLAIAIDDFASGLRELLYKETDNWGIYDPPPACPSGHPCCYVFGGPPVPSECNPCCVPDAITDPLTGVGSVNVRPSTCDIGSCEIGTSSTCATQSPYGLSHPYVYDPYYENEQNNGPPLDPNFFLSLREQLGKDDESQQFYKTPTPDPNAQQTAHVPGDEEFYVKDTTGYYVPPVFPYNWPRPPGDPRDGIFSYFYKMKNWGMDLAMVTPLNPATSEHCHWCDARDTLNCVACDALAQPSEIPQLVLPVDPITLIYNSTYRVDSVNLIPGNPPLTVDKVTFMTNIIADPNECAVGSLSDPVRGFWKYGSDRYCSPNWPYYVDCAKNLPGTCTEPDGLGGFMPRDCECGEAGTNISLFKEDELDSLVYGLPEMITWAEQFLNMYDLDRASMYGNVNLWYPDVSEWIEPASPPAVQGTDCHTCNALPGIIIELRDKIREIRNRLRVWLQTSYEGLDCADAWCVPPAGSCPAGSVPAAEAATFNQDGDATPGEVEEVLACLNYNVEGVDALGAINPVGTNLGNDFRFDSCGDTCSAFNCSNLPRSLVPLALYDPQAYVPGNPLDEGDIVAILNCFDNCNNFNCLAMPVNQTSTGTPYPYSTLPLFNQATDCTNPAGIGPNEPVGIARTSILAALIQAGPSCNLNPNGWFANTRQSALEARNQISKFRKRRDFLAGRINEIKKLVSEELGNEGIFTLADQKLTAFLDGPVNNLIQEVIGSRGIVPQSLPYHVVYGWQSDPPPGELEGLWHIVKVEARTPGRCDNACGGFNAGGNVNLNFPDPEWPRVRSYRRALGFRRCYELADDTGVVKFRTIRYDQKRDTQQMLKFPNQLKLWAFRSAPNPGGRPGGSPGALGVGAPGDGGSTCGSIAYPDPLGLPVGVSGIYRGAFFMNDRVSGAESLDATSPKSGLQPNANCWDDATQLLTTGIVSETCAAYYYGGTGMTFRFINCAEF